jgi:Uma2 family endonuclease
MDTVEVMPTPSAQLWPLTIEAYEVLVEAGVLPKNTEFLYGFLYKKMPKSPIHSFLVSQLLRLIQAVIGPSVFVRSEQPIRCGNSEPEPDVSVVTGTAFDYRRAHPRTAELVIEVCVSSHDYDRGKLKAYAVAGVKECWLALAPEKQVEVYSRPENGAYLEKKIWGPGGELVCGSLPGFRVDLENLFRD